MYKQSQNPKVNYSLSLLSDTLFELLKTRKFESITISELCDRSGVSRKTFYRNCFVKQDLVIYKTKKIINELYATIDWDNMNKKMLYENFFRFFNAYRDFLSILNKENMFDYLVKTVIDTCFQNDNYEFLNSFLKGKDHAETLRSYYHVHSTGSICAVLQKWTANNFSDPVDDLVEVLMCLSPTVSLNPH